MKIQRIRLNVNQICLPGALGFRGRLFARNHFVIKNDIKQNYQKTKRGIQLFAGQFSQSNRVENVRLDLMPTVLRTFNDGVQLWGLLYRPSVSGSYPHGTKYRVKYDPKDSSMIYLQSPDSDTYIAAPLVQRVLNPRSINMKDNSRYP